MAADEIRGPERGSSNVYKLVPIFTAIDALPEFDLRATMRNRYGDFSILKINPIFEHVVCVSSSCNSFTRLFKKIVPEAL